VSLISIVDNCFY